MANPYSANLFSNAVEFDHLRVAEPDDLSAMMLFVASPPPPG